MPGTYDASTVPAAAPGGHRSGAAPQVAQPLPGRPEPGARSAADIPGRPQLDVTRVAVLDTTVCDDNLGNWIIMDGIHRALRTTLPAPFVFRLPYAEGLGRIACRHARQCRYVFVGGGNVLAADMRRHSQWGLRLRLMPRLPRLILMGVGWWQYEGRITLYTRWLLHAMLQKRYLHSVRDGYTRAKLASIGIRNVVNTGCPALWELSPARCARIPSGPAPDALVTLTYYRPEPQQDRRLLEIVRRHYRHVFLWLQSPSDLNYVRGLAVPGLRFVEPSLPALDEVLATQPVDYVGTRLHAGLRALQFGRRTIIVGVDNRAREMHRDVGLQVVDRARLDQVEALIRGHWATGLRVPEAEIRRWKAQFSETADSEAPSASSG